MNTNNYSLICLVLLCLVLGLVLTRWWVSLRERKLITSRLNNLWLGLPPRTVVVPLLEERNISSGNWLAWLEGRIPALSHLSFLISRSGVKLSLYSFLSFTVLLFLAPLLISLATNLLPLSWALLAGIIAACMPLFVLTQLAAKRRLKFLEQLPDAIDLMISVLRSGHSVPQAVKTVANEIPSPCGSEFAQVFHRLNLGQSLPESLAYSVAQYNSFELDLITKACAIQLEVGGSLAELFEKTNATLRQRLNLKRQVRVLSAQGRLSAKIIAAIPLVIAFAFEAISPGYLQPLIESTLGRSLLTLAIALQIIGWLIMRRLSTLKV